MIAGLINLSSKSAIGFATRAAVAAVSATVAVVATSAGSGRYVSIQEGSSSTSITSFFSQILSSSLYSSSSGHEGIGIFVFGTAGVTGGARSSGALYSGLFAGCV